jgi:hypothetical protein
MRAIIIEDEYPAAERLQKLLAKADGQVEVVATLESVAASRQWLAVLFTNSKHNTNLLKTNHI